MVPEQGVAIALLTNGGDVFGLFDDVLTRLLRELTGVVLPARPTPPTEPAEVDPTPHLGHYADTIYDIHVSRDADGRLWLEREPKDVIAEIGEKPMRFELVHLAGDSFIATEAYHGIHVVFAFIGRDPAGRSQHVHYGRGVSRAD